MKLKLTAYKKNNKYFLYLKNIKSYIYTFELSRILNIEETSIINKIIYNNGNPENRIYFNTNKDCQHFIEWINSILIINKLSI